MPELKNNIKDVVLLDAEGNKKEGALIQDHHSIADIARWINENDWVDELVDLLANPVQL